MRRHYLVAGGALSLLWLAATVFYVGALRSPRLTPPALPAGTWNIAPVAGTPAREPMVCPEHHHMQEFMNHKPDDLLLVLSSPDTTLMKTAVPAHTGVQLCVPDAVTKWEWRVRV